MDSGVYLIINKNMNVETPIRLLFISNGDSSIMVNPRVHIDVKSSSRLTFIEQHVGNATSLFQNEVVYLSLEENSEVEHIRIQSNSKNTHNIASLHVSQSSNSR